MVPKHLYGFVWILGILRKNCVTSDFVWDEVESAKGDAHFQPINCTIEDPHPPSAVEINFSCADGSGGCIPSNFVCDFHNDCEDGSDEGELACQPFRKWCNFDEKICTEWQQDDEGEWEFQLSQSGEYNEPFQPVVDHTNNSPTKGNFLSLVQRFYSSYKFKTASLFSDVISGISGDTCTIRFWYNIVGDKNHRLRVFRRSTSGSLEYLTSYRMSQHNAAELWNRAELVIGRNDGEDFQIILNATLGTNSGSVNVDDISFAHTCLFLTENEFCKDEKYRCDNGKCIKAKDACNFVDDCGDNSDEEHCGTNCTFNENLCNWWSVSNLTADWVLGAGFRGHLYQGPLNDHTEGNTSGRYLYPRWKRQLTPQKTVYARLNSPMYSTSGSKCRFSFWYYIDNEKSSISLRIMGLSNEYLNLPVWTSSLTTASGWTKVVLPIGHRENFRLSFQAGFPRGMHSQIALDDFEFEGCQPDQLPVECNKDLEWKCQNVAQCIDIWMRCDGHQDCRDQSDEINCVQNLQPGDCDFRTIEECQWSVLPPEQLEWRIIHFEKRGHLDSYLSVDGDYLKEKQSLALATPWLESRSSNCFLHFWYRMKGTSTAGELVVQLQDTRNHIYTLWYMKHDDQDTWHRGFFAVKYSAPFRLIFRTVFDATDRRSSISIKDVRFTETCDMKASTRIYCKRGQFACGDSNSSCIPGILLCDGVMDCPNGKDEEVCKEVKPCEQGFSYCKIKKTWETCIPSVLLCDGQEDCQDGVDEAICGVCPENYCRNNGSCIVEDNLFPSCICPEEFRGSRCSKTVSSFRFPPTSEYGKDKCGFQIPVEVVIAVGSSIFVVIVMLYLIHETKVKRRKS